MNRRVIANEFNNYFVSLAPKLNESYSKTQIYYLSPQSTHIKNVNYLITNARVASNQNIECTR